MDEVGEGGRGYVEAAPWFGEDGRGRTGAGYGGEEEAGAGERGEKKAVGWMKGGMLPCSSVNILECQQPHS